MKTTLRPYQRDGVRSILNAFKTHRGFMLGDEMGLGKTIQALGVAEKIPKKHKRVAIIAPAGLVDKWRDEIARHLGPVRSFTFCIASYNELTKPENLHFFTQRPFDLAIFDEAHYLKDFEAQRTRACLGAPADVHRTVSAVSARLLGLSGTWPANRVGETYPWLYRAEHALTRGLTYEKFLYRYAAEVRETNYGTTHKGVKNMADFTRLLGPTFLRRVIDDVEKDIPSGVLDVVPVDVSEKEYKAEAALLREIMKAAGYPSADVSLALASPDFLDLLAATTPDFPKLSEFRKRQAFLKIKPVMDYLTESVLPESQKFIVFTYHTDIAEMYAEKLRKAGAPVTLVHGQNTDKKTRYEILKKADAQKQCVLVATIDSVREGYDLTGFCKSFYAEIDWRPYAMEQTQGRTRRIGQTHPVLWVIFHLAKGVEKAIAKRAREKTADILQIRGK
ncbi:MAG: DEAD/DEAH box helicase [Micavibrio sp.]|nr:DEAD/DEAH box helicase [Micavibrio sp.]